MGLIDAAQTVGVSSVTGDGFKEFLEAVENSREEYEKWVRPAIAMARINAGGAYREYLPELQRARVQREKTLNLAREQVKADSMTRVMTDLAIDRERNPAGALADRWDPEEEEEFADDEDDAEYNIIDRCE